MLVCVWFARWMLFWRGRGTIQRSRETQDHWSTRLDSSMSTPQLSSLPAAKSSLLRSPQSEICLTTRTRLLCCVFTSHCYQMLGSAWVLNSWVHACRFCLASCTLSTWASFFCFTSRLKWYGCKTDHFFLPSSPKVQTSAIVILI